MMDAPIRPRSPASISSKAPLRLCGCSSRFANLEAIRTDFDVIVVGAGPAGATAAKTLGEAGISTLILDKSDFPRDKPCGGGISARVVRRFPYLEAALAGIPTKWLSKVYFESPDGTAVSYESPERLYLMIRRLEFDHLLLSL